MCVHGREGSCVTWPVEEDDICLATDHRAPGNFDVVIMHKHVHVALKVVANNLALMFTTHHHTDPH